MKLLNPDPVTFYIIQPEPQHTEFKMAILVYKSLNDFSPQYQMDDCQLITTTGRWWRRSSDVATCDVSRTRTSLGDLSFTAAGPRLWNNLPVHLWDSELTLLEFCRLLKMQLLSRQRGTISWRNILTSHSTHYRSFRGRFLFVRSDINGKYCNTVIICCKIVHKVVRTPSK